MSETSEDSVQNARPIYKSSVRKLEYQRRYALKNREIINKKAKEIYYKNRDKNLEYFAKRYKANSEHYKKLNRSYYQKNREKILEQSRIKRNTPEEKEKINKRRIKYYAANKKRLNKKSNEWAKINHERHRQNGLRWIQNNREKHRAQGKKSNLKLKKEVFEFYGGQKCGCCGEEELLFLSLDHINGGGNIHRKKINKTAGTSFYRWLKKEGYPEGYQVLCFNCNQAKGYFGTCPHQILESTIVPL